MPEEPRKRGGRRVGSGKPKDSGKYGEPTVTMRVPKSRVDDVLRFLMTGKMYPTCPFYFPQKKPADKP